MSVDIGIPNVRRHYVNLILRKLTSVEIPVVLQVIDVFLTQVKDSNYRNKT